MATCIGEIRFVQGLIFLNCNFKRFFNTSHAD